MQNQLNALLELENDGWQSLCDGTGGKFYGEIMTAAGHMVLANGAVMTRDEVVESLSEAARWDAFEISNPFLLPLSSEVAALVYTGTGHRHNVEDFSGVMTSTYVLDGSQWKLALYQQTAIT